jgi:hypothetical protein
MYKHQSIEVSIAEIEQVIKNSPWFFQIESDEELKEEANRLCIDNG